MRSEHSRAGRSFGAGERFDDLEGVDSAAREADLDNGRFAIYNVIPFASSSVVTRQRFHVEDRSDRSRGGTRVTDVWPTRDFPETFRLRGHVALLAMYE